MNTEQAERMASAANNSRELRMLRATEKIAANLGGIHQTLAMYFFKMYEETAQDCMDQIAEMVVAPPPVEVKEKKT